MRSCHCPNLVKNESNANFLSRFQSVVTGVTKIGAAAENETQSDSETKLVKFSFENYELSLLRVFLRTDDLRVFCKFLDEQNSYSVCVVLLLKSRFKIQ